MGATPDRTEDGRPIVYATAKPFDTSTKFEGRGDGQNDPLLLVKMTASDTEKFVEAGFSDTVHIKEGYVYVRNAPFGARVDVEVLMPDDTPVDYFCRDFFVCGSGLVKLETSDSSELPPSLKLRLTVKNSNGDGIQDPPGDFELSGVIELFR